MEPGSQVLIFDINETCLDLSPLKRGLQQLLGGSSDLVDLWFRYLLHYSVVQSVAGPWHSFGEIGLSVLQLVAESKGIPIDQDQARTTLSLLRKSPPHADVIPALQRLGNAGYRLVALTNSGRETLDAQLAFSTLNQYFDRAYSVEEVGKYKPAKEVYHWALSQENILPHQGCMVAAHAWDVAGAKWAGLQTLFLKRPGVAWYTLGPPSDYVFEDLGKVADEFC